MIVKTILLLAKIFAFLIIIGIAWIFFYIARDFYYAYNQSNYVVWEFKPTQPTEYVSLNLIYPNILITQDDTFTYGLDPLTGKIVWQNNNNGFSTTVSKRQGDVMLVEQYEKNKRYDAITAKTAVIPIALVDVTNGKTIWQSEKMYETFVIAANNEYIVFGGYKNGAHAFWAVDIHTNNMLWDHTFVPGAADPVNDTLQNLLVTNEGFIFGNTLAVQSYTKTYYFDITTGREKAELVLPTCYKNEFDVISCGQDYTKVLDTNTSQLRDPSAFEVATKKAISVSREKILDRETNGTYFEKYVCYTMGISDLSWCTAAIDKKTGRTKWKILLESGTLMVDPYTNYFLMSLYREKSIKAYRD